MCEACCRCHRTGAPGRGPADFDRGNWITASNKAAAREVHVSKFWETALLPDPMAALPAIAVEDAQLLWSGAEAAERTLTGDVYTDGSTFHPKSRRLARSGCGFAQIDHAGCLLKGASWPLASH